MIKLSSFQKLLAMFFAFIAGLIILRCIYLQNISYLFMIWNLFLAWIPFQLSLYFEKSTNVSPLKRKLLFSAWLLFFPNALYVVTDLIHVRNDSTMPIWFDAILLFTSAIVALMMAFASLYKAEIFLRHRIRKAIVNKLIFACIFLGSFGVYLGRFLRWNSWDIVTNPLGLGAEIGTRFLNPIDNYRTWGITIILTCLFSLLYFAIKKLPGLLTEPGNESNRNYFV